jgi:hypothetical protein
MSLPIVLRPIAANELAEAMAWYRIQKKGLELELKDCVDEILTRIAAHPHRFHPVRGDVRCALLRRFPYAIHFLPEEGVIVVLAVFHTKSPFAGRT